MAYRKRKNNKNNKLSTGKSQETMRFDEVELKVETPDERIQPAIENTHSIKEEANVNEEVLVQKPNKLASKKGVLEKQNKHTKYFDEKQPIKHEKTTPVDNNDTDFSDQNNSDNSKKKPNETKTESDNINKIQDNVEFIEITIDTDNPIVPAAQSNPNETKKAEKQSQKSKSDNKNSDVIEMDIDAELEQTNVAKKTKSKNKDLKVLAQRLEQMKDVKLGNGVSLSVTYYQCDHCQRKFGMKTSLKRHMLMHLDLKPYSCSHCPNRKFRQRENWRAHMARKHKEAFKKALKYKCKICKKQFVLRGHLKLHLKAHADKTQHTSRQCKYCEKVFKAQRQLAQHEKYHMTPGKHKCATCSMSFDTRILYSDHLKSHRQAQDFICQLCGKSFLRASSIARHIRVNHSGMRTQCPVCNKLLKGHLSEHMRMHENQRPHECELCGQRFTQSTQLNIHKRSHTGDRPYPCRICKQAFANSNVLMLHIRRHTGEKPFECAMCPQTFSQLPHMKAHMRNIHNKTEFYKCNNCNTFFKLKTLLEAHAEGCGKASVQKKDKGDDTLVSRIRFLLALHFTMITSKEELMNLGFNKRLIDDILVDSIAAMGLTPCEDAALAALPRLQTNALLLLQGTVPKHQMALFLKENKSTEEILELLTDDLNKK